MRTAICAGIPSFSSCAARCTQIQTQTQTQTQTQPQTQTHTTPVTFSHYIHTCSQSTGAKAESLGYRTTQRRFHPHAWSTRIESRLRCHQSRNPIQRATHWSLRVRGGASTSRSTNMRAGHTDKRTVYVCMQSTYSRTYMHVCIVHVYMQIPRASEAILTSRTLGASSASDLTEGTE